MDSKLQIISGQFRGRRLSLPDGARPTQNRARVALFNMLMGVFDGAAPRVVWDAFAGSGAFGIECASRFDGVRVVFTDIADGSVAVVRKNLGEIQAVVEQADAIAAIKKYGADADLIFVDPPYANANMGMRFVDELARVARAGAIVVWEQDAANFVAPGDAWEILRDRQYGRARFLILRKSK